ncbi:MucBP domain-containing protein [Oceanobacillus bengalensis]|uniref:Cna B-type domain-containing protein n=1 Tax=Oceanobacillus bengalensis TaxID=1435466 RepID=A0A494YS75_9BACI|nr:MucBP domain-containing protein [Oceanobacillus bengalensis]RKQ12750.1 Cna B-type domain-containing protein [Oceanobacillus bengalensis]
MNHYLNSKSSNLVKFFMIFLLIMSLITSGFTANTVGAEEYEEIIHEDESGAVQNKIDKVEYEDSILSKKAAYTGKPGEYFIDLYIEGRSFETTETTDIVIVYDNSNSMDENDRDIISKEATSEFVSELLSPENNEEGKIQMALITYGTDVFDGRRNRVYNLNTDDLSHKELTTNANDIIRKLPGDVPNERRQGNNGGTFTQAAIQEAEAILADSVADNKHIITITDGVPTVSYHSDGVIVGNGTSFTYDEGNWGNRRSGTHGENTINEASGIQSNGITMSSIGIEITGSGQASLEEAIEVMEGIASTPEQYYDVEQVSDLSTILKGISSSFSKSIVNGTVTDPMGDFFNLKNEDEFKQASNEDLEDGAYYLSSSDANLLRGVNVSVNEETITLDHLNLGENEWINLRYKVQLDTEKENFEPNTYYPTNGVTTLQPAVDSDEIRNFPIPQASGAPAVISGTKKWEDYNQQDYRPEEIVVKLWKIVDGEDVFVAEEVVSDEDNWEFTFEGYPKYNSNGEYIEYFVKESSVDNYEATYSDKSYDITNTLKEDPSLELSKTSDLEYVTEVGQVITYTFEVENTGNVPISNIKVTDEMIGKDIELESTTLQPNQITKGTATYEVTQDDLDNGGITNVATVTGETPNGDSTEDEGKDYVPSSGPITVEHVDEEGNELAPPEKITGNVGEKYETNPADIDGYELIAVPENANGEFKNEPQTVTYVYKLVEEQPILGAPVTVIHVDEAGNELAPSEELTGNIGEPYESTSKEIDGYELIAVPENANGEFTNEPQTVTYVYKPEVVPGAPVTVIHVDEAGNELAPSEELTGNIGEPYESTSKEIDGYELIAVPENANGEFTNEPQTVTYVYKPVEEQPILGAPVTVIHVDEAGNQLAPSEELAGNIGEKYKSTSKDIEGYELIKVPENADGEFTNEPQTVTYVYKPTVVEGAPVTVIYIDKEGNELASSEKLTGNVGGNYTSTSKDIDGYELIDVPSNANGVFTNEPQTVTYVYEPVVVQGEPVTIIHVDEEGNELAPSEELTGNVGENYETTPKDIEGYELITVPENATGEFTNEPQTVTYVYKPVEEEPIPTGSVIVEYVDEDGNPIVDPEELTGNVGENYETTPKDIEGYELIEVPENATGEYTNEPQTVTYVYKSVEEEPIPTGSVIIEYVDEDGNPITDPEELTGNVGDPYKSKPKEIDGYRLIEVKGNEAGEFAEDKQIVTYIYEKIDSPEPSKGGSETGKNIDSDSNKAPVSGQELPKTATDMYNFIALGSLLLLLGLVVGFVYYRRQKLS